MAFNYPNTLVKYIPQTLVYSANIIAFDPNTYIATIDTPVTVSIGTSQSQGLITSQYSIQGQQTTLAQAIQNGAALSALSTDETGSFVGILNLPGSTFQTGQRVMRIDNRTVLTDPTTATTYSEATFSASGLGVTKTSLNFSPSVDSGVQIVTQAASSSQQTVTTIQTLTPYDPIAQTFIVSKDNFPNGVFLRAVKVFFATKPSNNIPVTLSIVGTLNGYPSGKTLDHSIVVKNPSEINVSTTPHYLDSTTYTEFKFANPVYIQPGILYAFLLKASSPDYTVYYAQQNSNAIPSTAKNLPTDANQSVTTKIGAVPYVGALFESQNSITWTADLTRNLMFVIDRCVFDITQNPTVQFAVPQNLPTRKLVNNDLWHKIDPNSATNAFGNYINANTISDAYNVTTTDFIPTGTSINYQYRPTLFNAGGTPTLDTFYSVTPGKYGSPTSDDIYLSDGLGSRFLNKNSGNSFIMTAQLHSTDANVSPIISDDGTTLYNIRNQINNMPIRVQDISIINPGVGYNANTIGVTVSNPTFGSDKAQVQAVLNANGSIAQFTVSYGGSGYVTTPTLTITGANSTPAQVSIYGETSPSGGNALSRYITKKVILIPGNDSADLRVYLTAYRPINSNIYVYYKVLSRNDPAKFDYQPWVLMTMLTNTTTFSATRNDVTEYQFAPGVNNTPSNFITYTGSNGQVYTNFSQFAIKVVFATSDSTNCPYMTGIRALALPTGTFQ